MSGDNNSGLKDDIHFTKFGGVQGADQPVGDGPDRVVIQGYDSPLVKEIKMNWAVQNSRKDLLERCQLILDAQCGAGNFVLMDGREITIVGDKDKDIEEKKWTLAKTIVSELNDNLSELEYWQQKAKKLGWAVKK